MSHVRFSGLVAALVAAVLTFLLLTGGGAAQASGQPHPACDPSTHPEHSTAETAPQGFTVLNISDINATVTPGESYERELVIASCADEPISFELYYTLWNGETLSNDAFQLFGYLFDEEITLYPGEQRRITDTMRMRDDFREHAGTVFREEYCTQPDTDIVCAEGPSVTIGLPPAPNDSRSDDAGDALEPNDDIDSAAVISEGEYTDLRIGGEESDYYVVDIERGETVTASIDFQHAQADLDMTLLASRGAELDTSISTTNSESVGEEVSRGRYLHVYSFDGGSASYDLTIDVEEYAPPNDPFEPNDALETAAPIAEGTYTDLEVDGEGGDFYAVEVDRGRRITATIDHARDGTGPDISLIGPEGRRIASTRSDTTTEPLEYTANTTGQHYLYIPGVDDQPTAYNFTVDVSGPGNHPETLRYDISEVVTNEPVTEEEPLSISVNVTNTGGNEGLYISSINQVSATFHHPGREFNSRDYTSVVIPAGESESLEFSLPTKEGDEGNYTLEVATATDYREVPVTVTAPFDESVRDSSSSSSDDGQDTPDGRDSTNSPEGRSSTHWNGSYPPVFLAGIGAILLTGIGAIGIAGYRMLTGE